MSESKTTASGGMSFASVLTLIFITLKLTGYIDWSWWWVLAPLWLPITVFLLIAAVTFIGAVSVLAIMAAWDYVKAKS